MSNELHTAAQMADYEWEPVINAFESSVYREVILKLREVNNAPQKACELLPSAVVNQGHELLNAIFRTHKLPYRLTRTETWANENRTQRKLALVRWKVVYRLGEQLLLPFNGEREHYAETVHSGPAHRR